MHLILSRARVGPDTTDGSLLIELYNHNVRICDTAEHTPTMLPPGEYTIRLAYDSGFQRKMPVIRDSKYRGRLQFGNGVYTLHDGSIILGTHHCAGLCIHSREAFKRVYDRIEIAHRRNPDEPIVLTVE